MADISKVLVGETQYDIKDETARGKVAGHVIKNASGTAVTQRANMQFKTAAVTDENGETVVRNVVQVTQEQYDALPESKNSDGIIYNITDATVVPAVVETVPIAQGGTGATTAAAARTNLGLGTAATKDSTTSVTDGGTGLPTSGAVYSAIDDVRTDLSDYCVVPSHNLWKPNSALATTTSADVKYTPVYTESGLIDYVDIDGTASGRSALIYTQYADNMRFAEGTYRMDVPVGVAGVNIKYRNDNNSEITLYTVTPTNPNFTITSAAANRPITTEIVVTSGTVMSHVKLYPMIKTAADYAADPSYVPYWICMRDGKLDIADEQVLGAWNLAKITAATQTAGGTMTVTVNSDKSIKLNTSGATTSSVGIILGEFELPAGAFYFTGGLCESSDANTNRLALTDENGGYTELARDLSGYNRFTLSEPKTVRIRLYVLTGSQFSNKMLYPMIATKDKSAYAPPAMTNRELTEVEDVTSKATFSTSVTWNTGWNHIYRNGKHVWGTIRFTTPSTVSSDLHLISLPDGLKPASEGVVFGVLVEAWSGAHVGVLNYGGGYIQIASNVWAANKAVVCSFNYLTK